MPFNNFNSRHFSDIEKTDITNAIKNLSDLLKDKLANLTPKERKRYGRVHEKNKLIINKIHDYYTNQSTLSSPDVDWEEFERDYNSRRFLETIVNQLESLVRGTSNAKILHDWDNYQNALNDYSYAQYKLGTSAAGYENKVADIKQFFIHSTSSSSSGNQKNSTAQEKSTEK